MPIQFPVIYKIVNKFNEKYYVGSSKNFDKRSRSHKYSLKKRNHHNDYLQNAWNKYGSENFEFVIVEKFNNISERDLLIEEQKWLDIAKTDPKNYNLTFSANNPSTWFSEYSKQKHSASLKKVIKTKEWKEKISESHFGIKPSEETKLKMSLLKLGRKQTEKQKENAIESRRKNWTFTSPTGEKVEIHDLKRFCKENNLHSGCMYWVASGKKYQYKGWKSYPPKEKIKYIATEEHRRNLSKGCSKDHTFISPKDETVHIHNLAKFCRENGLDARAMCHVAKGRIKSYKGWRKA